MNKTHLSALQTFIDKGQPIVYNDVPDPLQDSDYIDERIQDPSECPRCGEGVIIVANSGDQFEVRCHRNHFETIPKSERLRYVPDFNQILGTITDDLQLTVADVDSSNLPRFARAETERGTLLYLIYSPRKYKDTVKQIYEDALERGQPALLITPRDEISDIVELQFIFTIGHLVQAVPFSKLNKTDILQQSLRTAEQFEDLSTDVLDHRFTSAPGELRKRVNTNPRYILSILSNIRMLRENSEIKPGSGDLLEDTAEAVFMHLFPTLPERGGEADSGQNLPDNVFYLHEEGDYKHTDYEPILGIVDTKSGRTANFAKERIEGKHDNYLDFARKHSFRHGSVAHIFVVLDIDGQQEIKFFDRIKEEYDENMYMIVLTLDALITIFAAYLSTVVSNELKLGNTSFTRAVYPLFHRDTYNAEEHANLRRQFREVGRSQDEYQLALTERPSLMVITRDTVLTRFRDTIEDGSEIEELLNRYFK